jgi:hypothetical protein
VTDRIFISHSGPSTSFWLEGDLLSQDINANGSWVRCYLRAANGPSGSTGSVDNNSGWQAGSIDGIGEFGRHSGKPFLPSGYGANAQRWRDGPWDVWVPHNPDGSHPGMTFRMQLYYGDNQTASMGLPTIPRASTATFAGGATFDAGSTVTINTNRASGSFTHDITWAFGSQSGTIANGVADSVAWTPALTMLTQIPTATAGVGNITVVTKSGGSVIGTKTTAFTLRAAADIVPTISSLTVSDDNPTVASVVGQFVQGLSTLKATVNAAGIQGSTITASSFTMSGTTVASGGTVRVSGSGSIPLTASTTDSRGRIGTWSGTITALAYANPLFNSVLVRRSSAAGVVDDNGTSLRVDLNCAVSSLINGTERNNLTIKVYTRPYGTTAWTARNVITPGALAYNSNFVISGGANYPIDQSFDVRVEITDKFNTAAAQTVVATSAVFMHWGKTGVGMGKFNEKGTLDVAGLIYADGYGEKFVTDWNTAMLPGYYASDNAATNGPFAWWWQAHVVRNGGELIQTLRATSWLGITWSRAYAGGVWSAWRMGGDLRGTTGDRDQFFGTPSTAAAQAALANQKVKWFNTDLGWDESYYAPVGTTGLTARGLESVVPAGWYPIGRGPESMLEPTTTFAASASGYIGNWNGSGRRRGAAFFTTDSSGICMLVPGIYDFGWWTLQQPGSGQSDYHTRINNNTDTVVDWMSNVALNPLSSGVFTRIGADYQNQFIRPNSGRLRVLVSTGALNVHVVTGGTTYPSSRGQMYARWVRPALVNE